MEISHKLRRSLKFCLGNGILWLSLSFIVARQPALALSENSLPPMGWMSFYQSQGGNPTETLVRTTVTNMLAYGWRDAGYRLINIDAGWSAMNRLEDGSITWDTNRFPSGIPALVEWCHSLGFKVGLYTEPTVMTEWGMGSGGHFDQDAQTFADWGIDYIKFDPRQTTGSVEACEAFAQSINKTQRPIFLHSYLQTDFAEWVPITLNSFRKGLDIAGLSVGVIWSQWYSNFVGVAKYSGYVRPGFYIDFETIPATLAETFGEVDMLRGMLSVQAILAAPLIASTMNDPAIYPTDKMLQNPDMIAIDQDPAVIAGRMVVSNSNGGMVWVRPLGYAHSATRAICLFNSDTSTAQDLTVSWQELGLGTNELMEVYDCWFKTNSFERAKITRTVPPGSAALLRLVPPSNLPVSIYQIGLNYLSDYPWNQTTATNGAWTDGATFFMDSWWTSVTYPQPIHKDAAYDGQPLTIKIGETNRSYIKGLGMMTGAQLDYNLNGEATTFHMDFGLDEREIAPRTVALTIWLDGVPVVQREVSYGTLLPIDLNITAKTNITIKAVSAPDTAAYRISLADMQIQVRGLPPILDLAISSSGVVQIGVTGTRQQTVILEQSSDLRAWSAVATNTLTSARWVYSDSQAVTPTPRYYRTILR